MTLSSGFHMPGAFHRDGIHQGLFRPPLSPASSSGHLPPPAPSSGETPTPKRKRVRDDVRQFELANNRQDGSRLDHDDTNNAANALLITPAGRHVAQNGRSYTLAGQLDTPSGGPVDGELLNHSVFSDADYRKALGSKRSRDDLDAAQTSGPTSLFNLPHRPNQPSGWSTLAFSTLGGVVGKVWEFCKAGAFKGFHAGGGRGFGLPPKEGVLLPGGWVPGQAWHFNGDYEDEKDGRIPGRYPGADRYNDRDTAAATGSHASSGPSTPTAKRRQTAPMDDLGRNWVIVKDQGRVGDGDGTATARRTSPCKPCPRNRNQGPSAVTGRRISSPSRRRVPGRLAGAASCRATPRASAASTATISSPSAIWEPCLPASAASLASPRRPSPTQFPSGASTVVAGTASPTPATPRGHGRRRSKNGSQHSFTHSRTHSNASTASNRSRAGGAAGEEVEQSPRLSVEARQLAARRQREERDADVRIAAFNKQLQDMIRQGKEALGTTIEVDGEDGGWEDD